MDKIRLERLSFFGRHGVHPEERKLGALFEVDITMDADLRAAGAADDLALTVDYRRAYEVARTAVEGPPRNLIEAIAEDIARGLLEIAPIVEVTVIVRKRPPLGGQFGSVSVEVTRGRS